MAIATDAQLRTLTAFIRAMFPHAEFPDGPYQRCAQAIRAGADEDPRLAAQLDQGLRDLDARDFTTLDADAALALLHEISGSAFFQTVRAKVVTTLYDDDEVHQLLGWEGASWDQGGYLERGFDDLDWLPDVRIEEAS